MAAHPASRFALIREGILEMPPSRYASEHREYEIGMRYDPSTRVLSLSFKRNPAEHVDVMLETGRRMMTNPDPLSAWAGFGMAIGFGAVVGIVVEIHRRFVLPLLLGPSEIAPLGTVGLQLLPLVLLVAALYAVVHRRIAKRRRKALLSRLEPELVVDVDIFAQGIVATSGQSAVETDWTAVKDVLIEGDRIEIECESFAIYLPERVFKDQAAFTDAAAELRRLWRDALKRDHDGRMIAAGLD